jgi:hypothetical protein
MVGPASWVDVGLFSAEGGDFESLAVQVQNAAECGAWGNCIGPPAQGTRLRMTMWFRFAAWRCSSGIQRFSRESMSDVGIP